jgi:hypothetical protein
MLMKWQFHCSQLQKLRRKIGPPQAVKRSLSLETKELKARRLGCPENRFQSPRIQDEAIACAASRVATCRDSTSLYVYGANCRSDRVIVIASSPGNHTRRGGCARPRRLVRRRLPRAVCAECDPKGAALFRFLPRTWCMAYIPRQRAKQLLPIAWYS